MDGRGLTAVSDGPAYDMLGERLHPDVVDFDERRVFEFGEFANGYAGVSIVANVELFSPFVEQLDG